MIKIFEKNKNGKIQLDIKELDKILNEAYWEGYNYGSHNTWIYTSPLYYTNAPYTFTSTSSSATITGTTNDNTININTLKDKK